MNVFKMGDLTAWDAVAAGEVFAFEAERPRRVKFDVLCDEYCRVMVQQQPERGQSPPGPQLVAFGDGMLHVELTIVATSNAWIEAPDGAHIQVRGAAPDHRVPASDEASYTTVAPRVRQSAEMDRMTEMALRNEMARQAQFEQMIRQMAARQPAEAPNATTAAAEEEAELIEDQEEERPDD